MYPPLGRVQLFVAPEFAADARAILGLPPADSDEARTCATSAGANSSSSSNSFRFTTGLIIGVTAGALLHFGYTRLQQHGSWTDEFDHDGDGVLDEEIDWRNGQVVAARLDQNSDGHWDVWSRYENGVQTIFEADENFDGRRDAWLSYSEKGIVSSSKMDTDYDGVPDVATVYEHGLPKRADWRPDNTSITVLRQLFRHGVLVEELRDQDGDGHFEVSIGFDAFNTPVRTNYLRPVVRTP